ncbi:MFS transporter [Streptomyces sasae]|uniref:MFS transporter n=1 Tax=Streptomyces sasae TaxID=1266772 RepID=UPI00292E1141|nr:MFS transporter [Streptomyces sasae]
MSLSRTSLLRERNYRLVYTASLISGFGSQITLVAFPLVAVLALHASPLEVGVLLACATIAGALFGLPAGPWVDRMRRRRVMIVADVGCAILLGSIPLAWWLDALTMTQLYVVVLVQGTLSVFFDVAAQSYLPYVIGKDRLIEGNTGLGAIDSVARSAGPSLGGIAVSLVTAPFAIAADAVSYLCSAVAVAAVNKPEPTQQRSVERRRLRTEIAGGFKWLWHNPLLRPVVVSSSASNFFGTVSWVTLVTMMGDTLRLPAWVIGLVYSAGGVGSLIGAMLTSRMIDRWGIGGALVVAFACSTPFQLLLPLTGVGWWAVCAVAGQMGVWASISVRNILQLTIRQRITPDALLTRVNATARFISWGGVPLGSLSAGLASEFLGVQTTLWAAAVCLSLSWLPTYFSPLRSLHRLDGETSASDRAESVL